MSDRCADNSKCQRQGGLMSRTTVSRVVNQSSTHYKRNDRLAEGHDRIAGASMVLRCGALIAACHCLCSTAAI
jgi:hypothetical protein